MLKLFDQDYATEAYAEEKARRRERKQGLKTAVEIYQELGTSVEEAIQRLAAKFGLTSKEASKYVRRFWKK